MQQNLTPLSIVLNMCNNLGKAAKEEKSEIKNLTEKTSGRRIRVEAL